MLTSTPWWKPRRHDTNAEFEALAKPFLAAHPEISHEWVCVESILDGGRTDLFCGPVDDRNVFASLRGGQITIGTQKDERDFEHWGRRMTDADVAREAFDCFLQLLTEKRILEQ